MSSVIDSMTAISEEPLGPTQSVMAKLDESGDTKTIWDRNNPIEVEAARASFKRFKDEGYTAYSVKGERGERGEVITSFDPTAERIIFAPRMKGG